MRNFVQPGKTITVLAPANVLSGDFVVVGAMYGFAAYDALSGAEVEIVTEGVFDTKKKNSQAWTQGAAIYWDATAKEMTVTATDNLLVGHAVLAVANSAGLTTGRVRINL